MNRRNFLKGFIASTTVAALAPVTLVEVPVTETTKFVNFDELARITLERYRPVFADLILNSPHSLFSGHSNMNGGIGIVEPIIRS